jgi:hypothetical protein
MLIIGFVVIHYKLCGFPGQLLASQGSRRKANAKKEIWANTVSVGGTASAFSQRLDNHCTGVSKLLQPKKHPSKIKPSSAAYG